MGKARKDGEMACDHIEAYLDKQDPRNGRPFEALDTILKARGHSVVDWLGYLGIRERENEIAQAQGLDDFRFETNADMLALCKPVEG